MSRVVSHAVPAVFVLALALSVPCALAAAQRTFVASTGSDVNPCTLSAPCRSFTAAIVNTLSGGEVIVLDSAGYGPVVVNKPVSIIAPPGVHAGISTSSGTGIVVNPGSGVVTLRGLTLNGLGALHGIDYQSGSALYIENVTISGFLGDGIHGQLGGNGKVVIRDTVSRRNVADGALLGTSSGLLTVVVDHSHFEGSFIGLYLTNRVEAYAQDSVFDDNAYGVVLQPLANFADARGTFARCAFTRSSLSGVLVGQNPFTTAFVAIVDSSVTGNAVGITSKSFGTALVSNTAISANTLAVSVLDVLTGAIATYQNNQMTFNGSDGAFNATATPK